MFKYSSISDMSHEDLLEEYQILYKKYEEMCLISEENTQKKYDINKALDIAKLANSHLLQEVEEHWKRGYHRMQDELHEMGKRYNKLELSVKSLQDEHKNLTEQKDRLSQQLFDNINVFEKHDTNDISSFNETDEESVALDRLQILENENDALLSRLQEYKECSVRRNQFIADCEKNKDILEEQRNCLDENLKHNQMELEEKTEILQNVQEQLAEANVKIASLLASNDNNPDRKGNSLFSQVDDQRQALEQLLSTQKRTILEMKMAIMESKVHIHRLKCENDTIVTELNKYSLMFCNADRSVEEELQKRMDQLLLKNEELEKKLELKQSQLKELSIHKEILCLDIYLDMWKKETEGLKQQLFKLYTANSKLEVEARSVLQDTARWHLESIMSRWQIAKWENLLNDINMPFKPSSDFVFQISDKEIVEVQPRIVYNEIKKQESKLRKFSGILEKKKEENEECLQTEKDQAKEKYSSITNGMEMEKLNDKMTGKENFNIREFPLIFYDDEHDVEVTMKIITTVLTKPLRSILKKQQSLLNINENAKNVTFSKESFISYNVHSPRRRVPSPPPPSSVLDDGNKSNLKITRIFISSKKN